MSNCCNLSVLCGCVPCFLLFCIILYYRVCVGLDLSLFERSIIISFFYVFIFNLFLFYVTCNRQVVDMIFIIFYLYLSDIYISLFN